MIRSLLNLFRDPPDRRRFAGLGLAAVLALGIGFVAVPPPVAETLIAAGGYYYMLGLFTLSGFFTWRVLRARSEAWRPWLHRPGWPALAIVAAAAFAIWSDAFQHKILFDEYVLQGTAFQMHATKEVGTIVKAYTIEGSWQSMATFLDKRPYFFTFLVSLLHDFTGYRLANMFVLNAALAPVLLGLVYWLARTLTGRGPALLAVGLLATMPLLGQQATGAGMELHNLTMLALVMTLGVLYLRAPDLDRLSLFILGTVLLSQSRYESVIFVAPAALVILAGWWRIGRALLSWTAICSPLLLVPYAWHNRVLSATPFLWQLHEGQTSRFSLDYLRGNLVGAWKFFFNVGPDLANSFYLSLVGALGLGWVLWRAWQWARAPGRAPLPPAAFVLVAFASGILANLAVLMFYYWSRLDDVVASRFALPMCLLLAIVAALFVQALDRPRWPVTGIAAAGLGLWLFGWGLPAMAKRTYTSRNLVMAEVEWEHEQLLRRPGSASVLFVSNKSTIPFLLWHVPAMLSSAARLRGEQIKYHLKEGTLREVIVSQALRPTSANGDLGVEPKDLMPPHYRLEPFAVKRFGNRWMRLSRLVAIDQPAATEKATADGAKSAPPVAAPAPDSKRPEP